MDWWVTIPTTSGSVRFSSAPAEFRKLDTSSTGENADMLQLFVFAYVSLLADSPLNVRTGVSDRSPRELRRFYRSLTDQPIQQLIAHNAALAHQIVSTTAWGLDASTTGVFVDQMRKSPVFREYLAWFRTGDPELLAYVYSFLNFGKKMRYADAALAPEAFRSWERVEEKLSNLTIDDDLAAGLRQIIDSMILLPPARHRQFYADGEVGDKPSDLYRREDGEAAEHGLPAVPLIPKFGPGAVAEKDIRGVTAKACNLSRHPRLDRVLGDSTVGLNGRRSNLGYGSHYGFKLLQDGDLALASGPCDDISALREVPKTALKARLICMEPSMFMMAQQAILPRLLLGMSQSSVTRSMVDIRNQAKNKYLARYGSRTTRVDTIDLSAASDSVHVDLVRKIFPAPVLYFLLGTRTAKVRVLDGKVVRVNKFAPMGSALCFPVQSLIFSACVIYAALQWAYEYEVGEALDPDVDYDVERFARDVFRVRPMGMEIPGALEPAAVYGDDIIVDRRLTNHLISLLETIGFEVNTEKSFRGAQCFRESCGGFYWAGHDVSPVYFRVKRFQGKLSGGAVASLVALANQAGSRGYFFLRRLAIRSVLWRPLVGIPFKGGPNKVPFTNSPDEWGFFTSFVRNTHLTVRPAPVGRRYRRERGWQEDGVFVVQQASAKVKRPTQEEIPYVDAYYYQQQMVSRRRSTPTEFYEGRPPETTGGSRLVQRWVPVRA